MLEIGSRIRVATTDVTLHINTTTKEQETTGVLEPSKDYDTIRHPTYLIAYIGKGRLESTSIIGTRIDATDRNRLLEVDAIEIIYIADPAVRHENILIHNLRRQVKRISVYLVLLSIGRI